MRVLVTGAAGGVGQAVSKALTANGHPVVAFDRRVVDGVEQSIQGDILDREAVLAATAGCDTVIHLAATPDESDFINDLVQPNVIGLYHVADAARQCGVRKLVLASSLQVIWGHTWDHPITLEEGPSVVNHYALTKLWAENLGEMYARCYDLAVICARIGWLPRSEDHHQLLQDDPTGKDVFFSHNDAGRFFLACVETQLNPGQFEVLFATSKPAQTVYVDLSKTAQLIGFEPQDTWPEGIQGFADANAR